jgi:hypothetical protein
MAAKWGVFLLAIYGDADPNDVVSTQWRKSPFAPLNATSFSGIVPSTGRNYTAHVGFVQVGMGILLNLLNQMFSIVCAGRIFVLYRTASQWMCRSSSSISGGGFV